MTVETLRLDADINAKIVHGNYSRQLGEHDYHDVLRKAIAEERWELRVAIVEKLEREGDLKKADVHRAEANRLLRQMKEWHVKKIPSCHGAAHRDSGTGTPAACAIAIWLDAHSDIEHRFNMRQKLLQRITNALECEDAKEDQFLTRVEKATVLVEQHSCGMAQMKGSLDALCARVQQTENDIKELQPVAESLVQLRTALGGANKK